MSVSTIMYWIRAEGVNSVTIKVFDDNPAWGGFVASLQ